MLTKDEITKCAKAYEYAAKKHEGQTRKEGIPYITPPRAVAELLYDMGYSVDYLIAGLFHDLLEDTDATEEEIIALSSREVLDAVKLLTKETGYTMEIYVGKIRENPIAMAVKGCDRLHNLRSAVHASDAFRRRYIVESMEWYLDFHKDIREAIAALCDITPDCEELRAKLDAIN